MKIRAGSGKRLLASPDDPGAGKRFVLVVLLLLGGIIASLTGALRLEEFRRRELHARFQADAAEAIDHLRSEARASRNGVVDTAAFFSSSELVDEHEFEHFASMIVESRRHVLSLAWISVPGSPEELPGSPNGVAVPPVIELAYPGLDDGGLRSILERVGPGLFDSVSGQSDSDVVVVTPFLKAPGAKGEQWVVVAVTPVFEDPPTPDSSEPRGAVKGLVTGVVSVDSIVESASGRGDPFHGGPLSLSISDGTSPPLRFGALDGDGLPSAESHAERIRFGSREWAVEVIPTGAWSDGLSLESWIVIGFGVALTFLLAVFVASTLRQRDLNSRLLETLRRSEGRYRQLLEGGHLLVIRVMTGSPWEILSANLEWCVRMGVTTNEMVGSSLEEYLEPGSASAWEKVQARLEAGGLRESVALDFRNRDGSVVHTVASLTRAVEEGRTVIDAVLVDQTDRVRAWDLLAEAKSFSDKIIGAIRVGVAVLDHDLKIVTANPAFADLFLNTPRDLEGVALLDLVNDEADRSSLRSVIRGVLQQNARFDGLEFFVAGPGEKTRILRFSGCQIRPVGRDEAMVLMTIHDDTERRLAELEVRHQADELAMMIERAGAPILGVDAERRVVVWNRRTEIITELSKDQVCGKPVEWLIENLVASEHVEKVASVLEESLAGEELADFEFEILTPSGRRVDLLIGVSAQHDVNGRITGVIGVGQDVTTLKRDQREKFHAQKLEALGDLTGGIAHDFNNLLTVIQGNLELLKEDVGQDPGEVRELLDDAMSAALEGSEAVRRLLAFTRRQAPSPKLLEIKSVIADLGGTIRRSIGADVDLTLDFDEDESPVVVDRAQLENSLISLAVNAREAQRGDDKSVGIRVTNGHRKTVQGQSRPDVDEFVRIAVEDKGVGMTPHARQRAIEPFFSTKGPGRGSGLGLSFVADFAQSSSGFLEIESEEGFGTVVSVYLPRIGTPAEPKEDQGLESPTGHESVLVVEDEILLRKFAATCLKSLGYRVLEAGNAQEGISLLREGAVVDLVLSDIVMPGGMSGLHLAEELRRSYPDIAIQLMTGYSEQLVDGEFRAATSQVLRKPFTKSELARTVRQAIDDHLSHS